jgi:Na+/proline symporter
MINVLIFIFLIILYTLKGGIKTIIWTDTLQTTFMLLALVLSVVFISRELDISLFNLAAQVNDSSISKIFITDWNHERHFIKQFFSGMFITIVMTGLDQEMMQKNLSCKNIRDAQKKICSHSSINFFVVLLFLFLGALLLIFATKGITVAFTDDLFPTIALNYLGPGGGVIFLIS